MSRPMPCVLFAQTFVHPQLDEYVDEVLFAEPVLVTACEFLEQNGSSTSHVVSFIGATSPPSFALEIFVKCEAETRFRRLCHPFLYSHSSSNLLEFEAVVTNHMILRGSYRSLSLVIYGNTGEDLGQFNVKFNDNSVMDIVCSARELDNLPPILHSIHYTIEEVLSSPSALSLSKSKSDMSLEIKKVLLLTLKILELPKPEHFVYSVKTTLVNVICSFVRLCSCLVANYEAIHKMDGSKDYDFHQVLYEAGKEFIDMIPTGSGEGYPKLPTEDISLEYEATSDTSVWLVDGLMRYLCSTKIAYVGNHRLSQKTNLILGLSITILLCSSGDGCFQFVSGGGMEQIIHLLSDERPMSPAIKLLALGVIEQATRHPVGCNRILGWWPHEYKGISCGYSKGYNQLLKLIMQNSSYDVSSFSFYILRRLRFYEIASKYEHAVLEALVDTTGLPRNANGFITLNIVKCQLKMLVKLINTCTPIEDHSIVGHATKSLMVDQLEDLMSFKASRGIIGSANSCLSSWEIDSHFIEILKERGFLPLSAALLSSSISYSRAEEIAGTLADIVSFVGVIVLSLLTCRTGLVFFLEHLEESLVLVDALKGASDINMEDCTPLRYACSLLSKGFSCTPQEVGMILAVNLRVVISVNHLIKSASRNEELLWVLWDLCSLARSECGHEALLVLRYFPEAILVLVDSLNAIGKLDLVSKGGISPRDVAILHSAAEILEGIVTDWTVISMDSWIDHAIHLYKVLFSFLGPSRKDAPTRLLECIDAGVVYHKHGPLGLLHYCAALATGGDAHLISATILGHDVSDNNDQEASDIPTGFDISAMDNLKKLVLEKSFEGVLLRDSSVAQMITAIRILAFISEDSTIAATLFKEGALTVLCAIFINCNIMLERASNIYDYLVDEGTECNSSSDLLLERNQERRIVDLLFPSLLFLISIFHKIHEAKEPLRNTKLITILLRLHQEVSSKLCSCATDLAFPYAENVLGFGSICHLLASSLAFWPIYGWAPGLFHSIFINSEETSLLAFGPKETCSLLCLLNDFLPEEEFRLWNRAFPLLSAIRTLSAGTFLCQQTVKKVNWYLEPLHFEKLLSQFAPQLGKISQIIQSYSISTILVIQDLVRVFITRIAQQNTDHACVLVRPMLSFISASSVSGLKGLSEDVFQVYMYLNFIAAILDHPLSQALLLMEGVIEVLTNVSNKCFNDIYSDAKYDSDGKLSGKQDTSLFSWCLPVFKSFALVCCSNAYFARSRNCSLTPKDYCLILPCILNFIQVLPVGRELFICLTVFQELSFSNGGKNAFLSFLSDDIINRNDYHKPDNFERRKYSPLLSCWKKLLISIDSENGNSTSAVEAVQALSLGSVHFCLCGKSLNMTVVGEVKSLFGLENNVDDTKDSPESFDLIQKMITLLNLKITHSTLSTPDIKSTLYEASASSKALYLLLEKSFRSDVSDDKLMTDIIQLLPKMLPTFTKTNQLEDSSNPEKIGADDLLPSLLGDRFQWECPETLHDRFSQFSHGKRKSTFLDGSGTARRVRGEAPMSEISIHNLRGSGPSISASGPTRRDTFRLRKPNSSRPPSLHVDDYVARERTADGMLNSSVTTIPRGGRPPSIHVDEFVARQKELRDTPATVIARPSVQVIGGTVPSSDPNTNVVHKSKLFKTEMDDDLHGIDIIFDAEESELDHHLNFSQPDNSLLHQPIFVEQSSSHSVVEESDGDVIATDGVIMHDKTREDFSSMVSVLQFGTPLSHQTGTTSKINFSEEITEAPAEFDSVDHASIPGPQITLPDAREYSVMLKSADSRDSWPSHCMPGYQERYSKKVILIQPPLPPTPPPISFQQGASQIPDIPALSEARQPLPQVFQAEYLSPFTCASATLASSTHVVDSKLSTTAGLSPTLSVVPHPPLPLAPPPFSTCRHSLPSLKADTFHSSVPLVGLTDHSKTPISLPTDGQLNFSSVGATSMQPPMAPHLHIGRQPLLPATFFGSASFLNGDDPNILQNVCMTHTSIQSTGKPSHIQPHIHSPHQLPLTSWSSLQSSKQMEQGACFQNPIQSHVAHLSGLPQSKMSPHHTQVQKQLVDQPSDGSSQKRQGFGMSLQEYFKDPKAITSLLSNKEELCRLLEQHPKLMQMLQERLGQQ